MIDWSTSLTLEGTHVKLVPLSTHCRNDLLAAACDGELWKLWVTSVPSADNIDQYIADALSQRDTKRSVPFVIISRSDDRIIGSTRYMNIDETNRRLEIGHTWYAKSAQRTVANTEVKYLLLSHAFENYDTIAVEFRTHYFNTASRNAILRLGAKQDGILRSHKYDKAGNLRDTVVFSIIRAEWPTVKYSLQHRLDS